MKLPKVDLKQLEKEMGENLRQRREFARKYAEWLKKTPNKVWSAQQNSLLNK